MKGTGRRLAGPGCDLVEVADDNGVKHSALVVDPAHRDHPTLHGELEFGIGFMEQPEVTGLVRLCGHSPDEGAFVYPTGTVWSVAEVVRELAAVGEVCGVKAGLELCYMAGEILVEAADQSAHSGLTGHGSVDPWKLVLKADGQVSVIGYGLPRSEIEAFIDDDTVLPGEDSLRYCAPENLKEDGEPDLHSDLFALSLVALELMVGRPVYDGLVSDVKQQAQRGEAARKLYQWREKIPASVREVLGKALKPDPDTRFRDGLDFVYSVHDLLGGIDAGDGPSLRELVTQVRARQKRGTAAIAGKTGALSAEEMAELAADLDNQGVPTHISAPRQPRPDQASEDGEKPRWQRATRNRTNSEDTGVRAPRRGRRATPPADGQTAPPPKRGRRTKPAPGPAPTQEAQPDSARDRLLRRLRDRGAPTESAPETTAGPPSPPDAVETKTKTASSRRRRPGGRAAALLERLRSSSGETIPPVPPQVRRERSSEATTTEVVSPVQSHETSETVQLRRSSSPRAGATLVAPEPVKPEPVTKKAPAPQSKASGGVSIAYNNQSVTLDASGFTVGALADQAARALFLPSTDAMGTRVAAWRLRVDGKRAPVEANAASLPSSVQLERIDNQPRMTTVAAGGTKSQLVLGQAVPMIDLLPVLAGLFGLSKPFQVFANGRQVRGEEVLADLDTQQLEIRT